MQCVPKQASGVLPVLGGTLLMLLHIVYSVYQSLHKYFIVSKSKWLERTTLKDFKSVVEQQKLVSNEVKTLKKIPNHLVIILGTETLSIKNAVNLVLWSAAAGIPFVSFHDFQGTLKKSKDQLDQALEAAIGTKSNLPKRNGYSENGFLHSQVPRVTIVDVADGKELLVHIIRKLCAMAGKGLIGPGKPTAEELNDIIIEESGLPEANLAIYFGSICSMYGFMPWHSRITEFLPLHNSDDMNVLDYLSILMRFNRVEQRFGK